MAKGSCCYSRSRAKFPGVLSRFHIILISKKIHPKDKQDHSAISQRGTLGGSVGLCFMCLAQVKPSGHKEKGKITCWPSGGVWSDWASSGAPSSALSSVCASVSFVASDFSSLESDFSSLESDWSPAASDFSPVVSDFSVSWQQRGSHCKLQGTQPTINFYKVLDFLDLGKCFSNFASAFKWKHPLLGCISPVKRTLAGMLTWWALCGENMNSSTSQHSRFSNLPLESLTETSVHPEGTFELQGKKAFSTSMNSN